MKTRKATLVRQKEIILAARKLIVKYGSEHVTVRRMAKEIGVSEAAIYKHFKSKKDILSFLIDDIDLILTEDIEKNYSGSLDSINVLEKIMLEHISSVAQRRGVSFQVIAEIISLGDKSLNNKVYKVIEEYAGRIEEIFNEGIKIGVLRSDIDPHAAARLFFSMMQGLVTFWSLNQYKSNLVDDIKPMWEYFFKTIIKTEVNHDTNVSP
jgi:AcrR family transcriptional regulator